MRNKQTIRELNTLFAPFFISIFKQSCDLSLVGGLSLARAAYWTLLSTREGNKLCYLPIPHSERKEHLVKRPLSDHLVLNTLTIVTNMEKDSSSRLAKCGSFSIADILNVKSPSASTNDLSSEESLSREDPRTPTKFNKELSKPTKKSDDKVLSLEGKSQLNQEEQLLQINNFDDTIQHEDK